MIPRKLSSILLITLSFAIPSGSYAGDCDQNFRNLLQGISTPSAAEDPKALVKKIANSTREQSVQNGLHFKEQIRAIETIAKRDPTFKKLLDMFEQKQFTFAVDTSRDARMDILKGGIKNQHEIATSNGVFNPGARNVVESRYLRVEPSDYERIAAPVKPKSMYLVPEPASGIEFTPTHYSMDAFQEKRVGDTWILKRETLEDHTLVTIGDSLDRAFLESGLVDDWRSMEVLPDQKMSEKLAVDYLLPLDWAKTSIPFYYREVQQHNKLRFVEPDAYKRSYEKRIDEGEHIPTWLSVLENNSQPEFDKKFFKKFPELAPHQGEQLFRPYGNYVEGLHFGELSTSKIKAFIYHSDPPSPEELAEFQRLGIEVIDGRGKYK
jgi:hypothetical protein